MELEAGAIRDHVRRIVASPEFAGAARLQRFLAFVVETSLDGREAEIKETLVAVEVYSRPPGYSPQQDAIVRVEAGRLRARLRQYYEGSGRGEPIGISLPRGTYAPVFERRSPATSSEDPRPAGRPHTLLLAIVSVAVLLAGGWAWRVSRNAAFVRAAEPGPDATVLELYFRARQLLKQPRYVLSMDGPVPASVLEAVRLLEDATRRNPRFTRGWVSLAEANEFAWELDKARPAHRLSAAKAALERAIQLDPKLPEAWTLLASLRFYRDFDLAGAEEACRRAIELNPRDTLAQRRYLDLLRIQGRTGEGLSYATMAMSLDPVSITLRVRRAMLLYDSGRFHEAAEEAARAAALNSTAQQPLHSMALWVQGASQQQMGRLNRAEQLFRTALASEPNDTWNGPSLGYLLAMTGRKAEAEIIAEGLARRLKEGKGLHSQLALVYVGLGRDAEAIQLLEDGYGAREPGVLFARIEKRFERMRSDARFLAFLDSIERTFRPRPDRTLISRLAGV
jgi:tetratricopeptide (TPR) repeat protein